MIVWSLLGWFIFVAFMSIYVPMMWHPMPYLDEEHLPEPERWPHISVIVPARDEAADIERCLKTLLASDYPALEIIAVNDRSQDTTGQIMERLAAKDTRLKVVHIQSLPEGWLGKNHGVFQGVKQATKVGQRFGQGWSVTLGVPLAIVFGLYIFWRSALKTFFQKGIYWRDQFYPLKTLITNRYR